MATHSSILAWRIPWAEEPGRLQSKALQKVRHDWAHRAQRRFRVLKDRTVFFGKTQGFQHCLERGLRCCSVSPCHRNIFKCSRLCVLWFILQYEYPLSQSFREKPFTAGTYFSLSNNEFCTLQGCFEWLLSVHCFDTEPGKYSDAYFISL